jgi:cytochrome c oxidase subunit II
MGFLNKLMGIPPVSSKHGEMVDHMLELVHWVMLALFIGWGLFITYSLIRFARKRNARACYQGVRGNASSHLEIGVIITEIIILLGFAFPLWATQVDRFPDPDVRVNAWAQQFSWNFHYAGPDGKFGATNRFLISDQNAIGLDPEDPNSWDDFITSSLVLPKNKKIEIAVTSKDVIHNLALVGMRVATDADPGKVNRVWFVPTQSGQSEIICGQLCGPVHGNMRAICEVKETLTDFQNWEKEQTPVRDQPFAKEAFKRLGGAAAPAPGVTASTPAAIAAPTPPATPTPAPAVAPVTPPAPTPSPVVPPVPVPAPAEAPSAGGVVKLELGVIPNVMQFDKKELSAKAGSKVTLLFSNKGCALQHNFLLLKPGSQQAVGGLADNMLAADPAGAPAKLYVPDSPDVLVKPNKLIGLGQSDLIEFTAPSEPGDYPYICTFPGHWRLMNGVLKVVP